MIFGFRKKGFLGFLFLLFTVFLSASCSRLLGYGVLLWSAEDPPVPSGTVLPVYIRSNIDNVWVVGIPKEFRDTETRIDKFEIPLAKLELAGSRKKAREQAKTFAPYALTYAETLQDGLPIRENPDNGARRVYRLKLGEIIKILEPADGQIAVGATGNPLEGEWFRVLTEDGSAGYCFSYRLKLFEHSGGPLAAVRNEQEEPEDPALEALLSHTWLPESYGAMVNTRTIDLEEFSRHWFFDPGQDTGIARINVRDLDRTFSYSKIRSTGTRSWRFEGTQLQMNLRSETTLAVQFTESNGILRTLLFVTLPSEVDDIILQETARREELFRNIYEQGPVYTSNNYGTLTFREDGQFNWTGNMLLVPQIIPASALGSGVLDMRLFLGGDLGERYAGAFTLRFDGIAGQKLNADFMYSLDSQGFRIEHVPQTSLDGVTVVRRASTPLVIYFFKSDRPDETPLGFTPPLPSINSPRLNSAPLDSPSYRGPGPRETGPGNPPQDNSPPEYRNAPPPGGSGADYFSPAPGETASPSGRLPPAPDEASGPQIRPPSEYANESAGQNGYAGENGEPGGFTAAPGGGIPSGGPAEPVADYTAPAESGNSADGASSAVPPENGPADSGPTGGGFPGSGNNGESGQSGGGTNAAEAAGTSPPGSGI